MKTNALKLSALALTAAMMFSSCASQKVEQDHYNEEAASSIAAENAEAATMSAEKLSCAFSVTESSFPENVDYIDSLYSINNHTEVMLIGGGYSANDSTIYITDNTLSDFRSVILEEPEEIAAIRDKYHSFYPQEDGSITVYTHTEEREGMVYPLSPEEAADFDWEAYDSIEPVCADYISFYDKAGKLASYARIQFDPDTDNGDIQCIFGDSKILVIVYDNGVILRVDSDGSVKKLREAVNDELNSDDSPDHYSYKTLQKTVNGEWIYLVITEENVNESWIRRYEASVFDPETGKISEPFFKTDNSDSELSAYIGRDYPIMIDDYNTLSAVDTNGNQTELVSWKNSDISSMSLVSIGNNEFIGTSFDGNTGSLMRLTPKDPSDASDVITLTINASLNYDDRALINKFNRSQNKYRVVRNESNAGRPQDSEGADHYKEYEQNIEEQLKLDVIAGKGPDIISCSNYSYMVNLGQKGALADLYPLMENGSILSRSDFMPNLMKTIENSDGKLFMMPASIGIETIMTKSSICNKENWTVDDMTALYDNAPASAKHLYDNFSKIEMFSFMSNSISDAIDYEKGKCYLDTPENVKLLEFCNRFVEEVPMPDKEADGWDALGMYYADREEWWGRDETYLEFTELSAPLYYSDKKYYFSDGSDVTFVGYPSEDGHGGRISLNELLAVNSNCKNKEGAWEFIQFCITNTDQNNGESTLYPVTKMNDKVLLDAMNAKNTAQGRPMPNITDEDRKQILNYINSCEKLSNSIDPDAFSICYEEAERYFKGEISAEEAVKTMQNRVSLYVSEHS